MPNTYISPRRLKNTLADMNNFSTNASRGWQNMPDWAQEFLMQMDGETGKPTFRKGIWASLHRAYRNAGSGLLERIQEAKNEGSANNQALNLVAAVAQDIYDSTKEIVLVSKAEAKICGTHNLAVELAARVPRDHWPEGVDVAFRDIVQRYPDFLERIEGSQDTIIAQLRRIPGVGDSADLETLAAFTERQLSYIEEPLNRALFESHHDISGKIKNLKNKLYADTEATPFAEMAAHIAPDLLPDTRNDAIQLARQIAAYSFIGKYNLEMQPNPLLHDALEYKTDNFNIDLLNVQPGIVQIGAKAGNDFEEICEKLGRAPYHVEYGLLREEVVKATIHVFEHFRAIVLAEKLRAGGNTNESLPKMDRAIRSLNRIAPEHDLPSAQDLSLVMAALATHLDDPAKNTINLIALQIAQAYEDSRLQSILAAPDYRDAVHQLNDVLRDIPGELAVPAEQARKMLADSIQTPATVLTDPRMTDITAFRSR